MAGKLDLSTRENCVCFNLRSVTRAVTRFFDAEVRRHGIRTTQSPILGALQAKDKWGMAELSEWLGMERTTLVRNLRPLQREGLIRIKGEFGPGRPRRTSAITQKGRNHAGQVISFPAWRAAQDKVVAILGREHWSNMIRDLKQVAEELKKR